MTARRLPTLALAAVLPLTACSQDNPLADEGAEVPGGAVGPDAPVDDDLKLLQVQLEYPLDGAYEEGEDASLFFAIANSGTEGDTLVDITGAGFADARMADGDPIDIAVPEDDNVYVGAEGEPAVTLVGLEETLRSSESIPVTFVFENAGEVTLDAVVAAEGQNPTPTYDFPDPDEETTEEG
jgi:copper(I)-binding protein